MADAGCAPGVVPGLALRPLSEADLPAVLVLQRAAYGDDYQESARVLARKLELEREACWLAQLGGVAVGYVFAHRWSGEGAPPLHAPLAALPDCADHGFVHDLAVSPAARGLGVAVALFARVRAWSAAAGHRGLRLVALADAVPFWTRHGFSALAADLPAGYGRGACLMDCPLRDPQA